MSDETRTPRAQRSSWQVWKAPVRLLPAARRRTNHRQELGVALQAGATRAPGDEWLRDVACEMYQSLHHLLGSDAPHAALLENALFEAATSWPPAVAGEPISLWAQHIASGVALRYLSGASSEAATLVAAHRPGSTSEMLARVYASLRKFAPEEHVAFAWVELAGRSESEVAAVLRVPELTVRQRVGRVRRRLLLWARGDRLLARYWCVAARLGAVARRLDPRQLVAASGEVLSQIRAEVRAEVLWFVSEPAHP